MRILLAEEKVPVPKECTVTINDRIVSAKGPRGAETLDLSHMVLTIELEGDVIFVRMWNAKRKHTPMVRTCASLINNLVKGCTKGFSYKMKAIYKHFPITMLIEENGKKLVIKNFLGNKKSIEVPMPRNTVAKLGDEKDYLLIQGPSIADVSQTAAKIAQWTVPKDKDLRIFLDGIFTVSKELIESQ